jgi:hypothetical protein
MNKAAKIIPAAMLLLSLFAEQARAATSHAFAAFNVGTLTGGGAAFTKSLDVSGLTNQEYLFVRVTANYQSAAAPNDAYSTTMDMELSNGGAAVFWPAAPATVGAVAHDSTNTLIWCGLFPQRSYIGGTNLTIAFMDTYTDSSGPYYSTISNVVVTIYPATAPSQTFSSFNVGTLTGGGSAFAKALNVSGLPHTEYLFARVAANYQSAPATNDAYPSTMDMELSNGGTNVFWPGAPATVGAVAHDSTNTLIWCGLFPQNSYIGGTNLTIQFVDTYTDASGPYYSTVSNVTATLYPATTPSETFSSFNVGTLTGGGAAFSKSLSVAGLPSLEFLFVRVTAQYQSAASPHDGYSSTLNMELSDGATNVFWPAYTATVGAAAHDSTNTLIWCGLFPQNSYIGGTNLTIQFVDPYTDASGPYYSTVSNVVVSIYPAVTPTPPHLGITRSGTNVVLTWPSSSAGFTLQSATNLAASTLWTNVATAPVVVGTNNAVTNGLSGTRKFFRLSL